MGAHQEVEVRFEDFNLSGSYIIFRYIFRYIFSNNLMDSGMDI